MKFKYFVIFLLSAVMTLSIPISVSADEEIEKPVIVIDPGHGGIDGGTTAGIRTEKVYNFLMAQYLKEELLNHGGFEVVLTRESDIYLKFLPRAIKVVEHDADLLLSLHCNSSTYSYVNGVEAYTSLIKKYSCYNLGNSILAKIENATGIQNRGVKTREDTGDSLGVYFWDHERNWDMPGASHLGTVSDYFSINTWGSKFGVPSLIVEHGYLSHSGDRELMDQDETLRKIAKAEADALIEYYYGHTHAYTAEKVVDFPSNCALTGTKSYHCTICGIKKDTEKLPEAPDAHFYRQSGSMRATCSEDGFIEYTCQITYNMKKSEGYNGEVHTYMEILPKTEHSIRVLTETPASHGTDGQRVETCDNCGETWTTVLPGTPHTYDTTEEIPSSCTESGHTVYTCTECGHSYTEEHPATGHSLSEGGICTLCGLITTWETGQSTGPDTPDSTTADPCYHDFAEISRTEPSCEKEGTISLACTLCGEEKAETLPASGHSYGAKGQNGEAICSVCGKAKTNAPRSTAEIFKNPLFAIIIGVLAGQAIAFLTISLRNRRKTHKSRRRAHTVTKSK